jgi:hypothetical protein
MKLLLIFLSIKLSLTRLVPINNVIFEKMKKGARTKGLHSPENPNNNIMGADLAKENHFD